MCLLFQQRSRRTALHGGSTQTQRLRTTLKSGGKKKQARPALMSQEVHRTKCSYIIRTYVTWKRIKSLSVKIWMFSFYSGTLCPVFSSHECDRVCVCVCSVCFLQLLSLISHYLHLSENSSCLGTDSSDGDWDVSPMRAKWGQIKTDLTHKYHIWASFAFTHFYQSFKGVSILAPPVDKRSNFSLCFGKVLLIVSNDMNQTTGRLHLRSQRKYGSVCIRKLLTAALKLLNILHSDIKRM